MNGYIQHYSYFTNLVCMYICVYISDDPIIYHSKKDTSEGEGGCYLTHNSPGTRGIKQNCPEEVMVDGQAIHY